MNKKRRIAVTALTGVLATGMVFASSVSAYAAQNAEYTKNENVYVRMNVEGEMDGTYVVNTFTVTEEGEITDYGDYSSIHNLTNLDEIQEDKDEYTILAEKGKFYYQGNMETAEIPWNFAVQYILDGKEVSAEELAGAEGDLEIYLKVTENLAAQNPAFYQAYLLQVTMTLDSELCEDIVAEGASISDAGADERITFTVMPPAARSGESDEMVELSVKTTVKDFEMDDISIAGAAVQEMPVSFVSEENQNMGQTMFIMSVQGIAIPEEEMVAEEIPDERNLLEKLIDKIKNHNKE